MTKIIKINCDKIKIGLWIGFSIVLGFGFVAEEIQGLSFKATYGKHWNIGTNIVDSEGYYCTYFSVLEMKTVVIGLYDSTQPPSINDSFALATMLLVFNVMNWYGWFAFYNKKHKWLIITCNIDKITEPSKRSES